MWWAFLHLFHVSVNCRGRTNTAAGQEGVRPPIRSRQPAEGGQRRAQCVVPPGPLCPAGSPTPAENVLSEAHGAWAHAMRTKAKSAHP
jgi:hypothetical protein